ncbi:hypothetical protein F2Q69_00052770 [Brassica cretica]|uniref:Uncharacterized protein n=1 Tax=Brassica cretica TaxID=69181 RepID=A0A8S9MWA2_BRACR|nr:hypothetical protein F2Q69_00052770 [Brassica cretica]
MTNDNNTTIDTTNVTPTPLNVVATDAIVTTAGTITASTAATTTTTLPVDPLKSEADQASQRRNPKQPSHQARIRAQPLSFEDATAHPEPKGCCS